MATDSVSGLDYPASTTAPAGAAQIMALALSARGKTIRQAVDSADRDARFGAGDGTAVPDGMIVTAPAVPAVWMKLPGRWATLFQGARDFTPQVTTAAGAAVSSSKIARCYYEITNDVCHAHAEVQLNAAAAGASISLPVPAKDRLIVCGSLGLYGASTPADQSGLAYMSDTTKLVVTAFTQGYRDGSAGHYLRYDVHYAIA